MTDRRSDRPQSRTLTQGQSVIVHGVRIDCVSVDGETCRVRVWREIEIQPEGDSSDDIEATGTQSVWAHSASSRESHGAG